MSVSFWQVKIEICTILQLDWFHTLDDMSPDNIQFLQLDTYTNERYEELVLGREVDKNKKYKNSSESLQT